MTEVPIQYPRSESRAPGAGLVASVFVILLVLRLLLAEWSYFWEQDDISIAAGVAALVRGEETGLYRYGPQLGYYRLIEVLVRIVGGELTLVPHVMIGLSAASAALLPVLALAAFRSELREGTRRLLALVVAVNPILWSSGQYGNSAMPALALVCVAVTLLSNGARGARELAALGLFGLAVLVRADSILVAPVMALLLRRTHASAGAAAARLGAVGVALAVTYLGALRFDPHMDDVVTTTSVHLFNPEFRTRFWEYLIWSFSPLVLVLAAWGWRDLLDRRDGLLAVVSLWAVPVFGFYFGSTTTPRYALLAVIPVSICATLGAVRLGRTLEGITTRRWIAAGVPVVLVSVHLVAGLGQFTSNRLGNVFRDALIFTHDGPHPTGGFLWHGLATIRRTLARPRFGENVAYARALETWLASPGPARRIVYLSDGHPAVAFRYHALVGGARVVDRMPGPDDRMATMYRIGGVTVMWVDDRPWALDPIPVFDVAPGDEFWNMQPAIQQGSFARFPPGLAVEPIEGPGGGIRAYRFVPRRLGEVR